MQASAIHARVKGKERSYFYPEIPQNYTEIHFKLFNVFVQ